jgi:hypothetical protein
MATLDVLQRAAAGGANLIISHEPTFYGHLDQLEPLEKANDAITAAKRAFIRDHKLVVLRMHDHWHRRRPDGIATGMTRALGWEQYRRPESEFLFTMPVDDRERSRGDHPEASRVPDAASRRRPTDEDHAGSRWHRAPPDFPPKCRRCAGRTSKCW